MAWKTLDDLDMQDKTVLVRVDINVPMEDGRVTDATRIERIVPTIKDILEKGGRPVLLAHFGRPKGQVVPEMSLAPLVTVLGEHIGAPMIFAEDCIGAIAKRAAADQPDGSVLLLENTRFHAEEEANDPAFAAALAALGEVFVNDAFSAAHRAHGSTTGVARLLPSCAGRLMEAELNALEAALKSPKRPLGAVVGGAKVSTKLDLLNNLVEKLDALIIGGGMANTFLIAKGANLGASLAEPDLAETALEIMAKAEASGCRIILPDSGKVAKEFKAGADFVDKWLNPDTVLDADDLVLDIGADAISAIVSTLEGLETLIWNGPLGAFEISPFDEGTVMVADIAAYLTRDRGLVTVAGGGDTIAALNHAGVAQDFTYISTAGGAFLEWMEGKDLPGVTALTEA